MHLIQKLYIYLFNHEVNKHEKITRLCVDKKCFFPKLTAVKHLQVNKEML